MSRYVVRHVSNMHADELRRPGTLRMFVAVVIGIAGGTQLSAPVEATQLDNGHRFSS